MTERKNITASSESTVGPALAGYPHAKLVGNLLFVSGASARQADGTIPGAESLPGGSHLMSIGKQTEATIENIKAILEAAGVGLENIVDLTVFLVDMRHYEEFNRVYNQYFDADTGPARTTVAVASLPGSRLLIEIKAVAHL